MAEGVVNSSEDVNPSNIPITLSSVYLQVVQFNGALSSGQPLTWWSLILMCHHQITELKELPLEP